MERFGRKMEVTREQIVEAIKGICEYDTKLAAACEDVIEDLKSGKVGLNSKIMENIIQGINWTVEVLNRTMDTINEEKERLNKEELNSALVAFSVAYETGDGVKVADAMKNAIIPLLQKVCVAGGEIY